MLLPARATLTRPAGRAPFARLPVLSAVATLLVVLLLTAQGYGWHRDELYFRLLPPAWGYVDQPPLTPLIVHGISRLTDSLLAVRAVPAVLAAVSVVIVALIAREVGGNRAAQGLAAWGYGFGAFTLVAGHVLLTASVDLVVWPAVLLAVIRARLRDDPRWWLVAGAVAGVSLVNKLLVAVLLVGIAGGALLTGPRRGLISRWTLGAAALVLLLGAPTLLYQALHGFPQLAMGRALAAANAPDVRPLVVPFLFVWIGPPLSAVWVAALVALLRRPDWRPIRFLAATFAIVVALTVVMGTQTPYPYGVLAALYAVGCEPVVRWVHRAHRRVEAVVVVVANSVVSAVIALPILPIGVLGLSPVPALNVGVGDTVGWPAYAAQVAAVVRTSGTGTVVLARDYGEAGALDRFEPELLVVSGHNALPTVRRPPDGTRTVVTVGGASRIRRYFDECRVAAHLDNGVGVESEEQGVPVSVCTGPRVATDVWWRAAAYLG